MDLDAFAWLLTDDGQQVLASAVALGAAVEDDPLAAHESLRRTAPEAASPQLAVALSQAALRRAAVPKFGDLAARMYFTPEGLEQATRLSVARHRAARVQAFDARSVVDLGCGIGGDLVALASAGITTAGVDLDPERVAVATANLAALGLGGAVQVADATELDHRGFDVAFADPARRSARGRLEVRRPCNPDVLHVRGTRAGHPAVRRHAPGRPGAGLRRLDRRRPRLRHRR